MKNKEIEILMFCCKGTKARTTGCKYTGEGELGGGMGEGAVNQKKTFHFGCQAII
jgi:hypothetical protein